MNERITSIKSVTFQNKMKEVNLPWNFAIGIFHQIDHGFKLQPLIVSNVSICMIHTLYFLDL